AARLLGAPAIVTLTRSGFTSRLVSSYRPPVPILGVSNQLTTYRQLALVWGVHPVHCPGEATFDSLVACARQYLITHGLANPGDRVVVTAGIPFDVRGTTTRCAWCNCEAHVPRHRHLVRHPGHRVQVRGVHVARSARPPHASRRAARER